MTNSTIVRIINNYILINENFMEIMMKHFLSFKSILTLFLLVMMMYPTLSANAASAKEIEIKVKAALERFEKEVGGAKEFLKAAKGVLIMPGVVKAGFVIGGEYGEGAMQIAGKTVDYYSIASGSFGFQLGAQKKDIVIIFMEEKALKAFRNSEGWKAGVDGSVALIKIGEGLSIDTEKIKDPIVAFVFGQKGLMYNLTLEGSKFTKLDKKKD